MTTSIIPTMYFPISALEKTKEVKDVELLTLCKICLAFSFLYYELFSFIVPTKLDLD